MEQLQDIGTIVAVSNRLQAWEDTVQICNTVFAAIEHLFANQPKPPVHWTDSGDLHHLAAIAHCALAQPEAALDHLCSMVCYDIQWMQSERLLYNKDAHPLVRDMYYTWYDRSQRDSYTKLRTILLDEHFTALRENPRFQALLEQVETEIAQR